MKWPLLCLLVSLTLACPALLAGDFAGDTYINDAVVSYPGTETHPPMIDATNFINNNSFSINFTTFSLANSFYETYDTVNFVNNGTMVANTGFRFDTQSTGTGLHSMAGSFNNAGSISCASIYNTNSFFYGFGILGFGFFGLGNGYAQFNATATNIVNSGFVDVGVDGLMQFTGQNVDLTRSRLLVEGFGLFSNQGIFGTTAGFGTDTNGDFYPSIDLGPTYAYSSAPAYLYLTNTTPYIETNMVGTNLMIVRAVFLANPSLNVTNNVYYGVNTVGPGGVVIEWVGSYLDPSSGTTLSNYLYLANNYVRGSSTNVNIFNGIPDNFTFLSSPTPVALGLPTASGLPPGYTFQPGGAVTNTYSYVNAQLTSSTVTTNSVANYALTNLPGRIEISAANNLDLTLAEITGANYLSVQCTNQFNGNEGAYIAVPYADLNLGVTNGYLTVTNLLASAIPNWSGNIQAWSGRWLYLDANGVTNDYRVLIVNSQIVPTAPSQVQDLILHGTNSIVISDTFNVIRKVYADAQNLTLTTNGPGVGAQSLDGELNFASGSIFWQSSLPNLRNLTNNGAIRLGNLANFGGPLAISSTTNIPAVKASGTLSKAGALVVNVNGNDKLIIGTNRYAFVTKLTNTIPNQVKIGTTFDLSFSNLIAAINGDAGAGTKYSSLTKSNLMVVAGGLTNHAFAVTARLAGAGGNLISTLTAYTNNLTWNGRTTLAGGVDFVAGTTNVVSYPYNSFINSGVIVDQGAIIYTTNFVSSGVISNGIGSFTLQSQTATLTNGSLQAGGDVSIATGSLVTSNLVLQAGRSLTLRVTNLLTDTGVTNGSIWSVGAASVGTGLNLPIKPPVGDLLGTTITNFAPTNTSVLNTWAGVDRGLSTAGYTNNEAVGRLILDPAASTYAGHNGAFVFKGSGGTSNALYVDYLELRDFATNHSVASGYDFPWLQINTNMMIYYAQAVMNGISVAEGIDQASKLGFNRGRLRWISSYVGQFSSTNLVYPPGVTNTVNTALAESSDIDSNGNGIVNSIDPTPFFVPAQINFSVVVTNVPPLSLMLQWTTIPLATNYIYYRTNMVVGTWLPFTNFNQYYYGSGTAVTNATHGNAFISPTPYPSPATNVWLFDPVGVTPHYYQVVVQPWETYPY